VLAEAAFANVPLPLLVHAPDVELDDEAEIATEGDVEHIVYGPPALLVGTPWIVNVAFPTAGAAQGAIGFAVHVSMRLPAVTSAALGV
jgi:hypothetical protein